MSCDNSIPQRSRSLISRSTILILASLLIWVGAGRELPNDQNAMYLLLGLFGIISYLGLERAAYRRLQQEYSTTQALYRLEQRLHAQQEFWAEALGVDPNAVPGHALPGAALIAARLAGNAASPEQPKRWNTAADLLRLPVVRTGKTAPDDTFLAAATTQTRLA
jgi:hypothetical protein